MQIKSILAALMLILGLSNAAQASLLNGQTVGYQYHFPNISTNYANAANGNYLVGAGVEVSNLGDSVATLDISDTNLLVSSFAYNSYFYFSDFSGFEVFDVFNTIADITSVTINAATNMFGLDASRITFDANHIWVNFAGLNFTTNTIVSLDINSNPQAVPEPESLALLSLALLGFVWVRRKKA